MKAKKTFAIIHFQPLERFPPVMNMISWLENHTQEDLIVFSNCDVSGATLSEFKAKQKTEIIRHAKLGERGLLRLWYYSLFYVTTLYILLRKRPHVVLYYESISAWPALMYKKIRGSNVSLSVHYHEYSSEEDYRKSMKIVRWSHRLEKTMYERDYKLMSHTNEERLKRFIKDNSLTKIPAQRFFMLPNFPSKTWKSERIKKRDTSGILKLVYVGSIGLKNTYINEIVTWVTRHSEKFSLDIYAYNLDADAKKFLSSISSSNIHFVGSADYHNLPSILQQYDIGLVIYKPFSESTVIGVSNKVFEYLACGLDVWFPKEITYSHRYVTNNYFPKIVMVDFKKMDDFNFLTALEREGLQHQSSTFFFEDIYSAYYKRLLS